MYCLKIAHLIDEKTMGVAIIKEGKHASAFGDVFKQKKKNEILPEAVKYSKGS